MLSVSQMLHDHIPLFSRLPAPLSLPITGLLRKVLREESINAFLSRHSDLKGFDFIDEALEYRQINFRYTDRDREKIPASGRVIIIANHPLGSWDALALLKLIGTVRRDVKIVANELLWTIEPLRELLLPLDVLGGKTAKNDLRAMTAALGREEVLIIFPAGEVSRLRPSGVKDTKWKSGFLTLARKTQSPILPVHITARNSWLFYTASTLFKPLGMMLLPYEMLHRGETPIDFRIGRLIPYKSLGFNLLERKSQLKLLRKQLYNLPKGKKSIFATQQNIALPVERRLLKEEIAACERLGQTNDGKAIYLYDRHTLGPLLMEIGRLREITFRRAGEGSGKRRDLDDYDRYYKHIVLWDEEKLELVGSYRIGLAREILEIAGVEGFYTASLFHFSPTFLQKLPDAIELGRSFVQPAYWGSRALDYLWQGISAFLASRPQIRYMFGPVSLSASLPTDARNALVWFYQHYFGGPSDIVRSNNPLRLEAAEEAYLRALFSGSDYTADLRLLKEYLHCQGVAIPTLYKHYTELTEPGGVEFLDFGIDEEFENCVDGFIIVDLTKILESKRKRYIGTHL